MITDSDSPLLICYDGSENAKYAIERAGALLAGRRAVVVTVWQPTADLGSMVWSDMPASMVDFVELDRAAAEGGGCLAEEGVRIAHESGLEADAIAVKAAGPVWKTILEIAERRDAAAIVMGSRGLAGIRSMLLGSVSNAVVHHAERPTLVVHIPTNDAAHAHEPRS
jgi:nucleotide-binding universal stress UspA family protein